LRVKVYGGLYHGRVLVLPEGSLVGDYVELPETLPAGEMHSRGRTHPENHRNARMYKVEETAVSREKYLANISMRFVRTVDVPPPTTIPVTVHLR